MVSYTEELGRLERELVSAPNTPVETAHFAAYTTAPEGDDTASMWELLRRTHRTAYALGEPDRIPTVDGDLYGLAIDVRAPAAFTVEEFDGMVDCCWPAAEREPTLRDADSRELLELLAVDVPDTFLGRHRHRSYRRPDGSRLHYAVDDAAYVTVEAPLYDADTGLAMTEQVAERFDDADYR